MNVILKNIVPTLVGVVFIYAPFLWCRLRREDPLSYGLSWHLERRNLQECILVTAIVLVPLTIISMNWPMESLPRHSSLSRTLNIGSAGLAAAIIEEIFYRGWIQPLFRKKFSALWSVVFTSAIFALSHIFVAQTPFLLAVFFPGCIMGYLRERHGNIATSTLFHAFGNIWAIWFIPMYWPTMDWIIKQLSTI